MQTDDRVPDVEVIGAMTATLAPRGPDASGIHRAAGVALGHRRLKVIDLEGSPQPMGHAASGVQLVYNGEIYNFVELAETLRTAGHPVGRRSDTEVLLYGYLEWGEQVVERINGMFAFAVWDPRRNGLLLARDRLGQKPLYLARIAGAILFASELKAILRHPDFHPRLDADSLRRYLVHEYVPDPHAIVRDAGKLAPGELVWVDRADLRARHRTYWDLSFPEPRAPERRLGLDEAAEELRARLGAAARRRLVSDVPLGVFLSGGIDSSTLVALLSRNTPAATRPGGPLRTFTIGFAERSFDEADYADEVAAHEGTDHHVHRFDPPRMLDVLPEVTGFLDEPFGDASVLPTYLLCRFTRQTVTVALAGDGGDELFAGYPTFQAEQIGGPATWLAGRRLWAVAEGLAAHLPTSSANFSWDFVAKQFLRGLGYRRASRHQVWLGSFTPAEILDLLDPDLAATLGPTDPLREIEQRIGALRIRNRWDALLYFYVKYYLAGDILVKADRASMAVGLEVRAPFLDPHVVQWACAIAPAHRLRGFTTKAVCRRAAAGLLPKRIVERPKKGFGVPMAAWLQGPLRPLLESELGEERLRSQGVFRVGPVRRLVDEHLSRRRDNRKQLWTLLAFQHWFRVHKPALVG